MTTPALTLDPKTTAQTLAYLQGIAKAGPEVAADALNHAANMWHREVVRHCPVDSGLLRQSIAVHAATAGDLTAIVGTNVPYAVFIEFGTPFIASGAVKAWEPGDAVILDWPAKSKDARGDNETGGSREEFMPPFRGSWEAAAPKIIDNMRRRLAALLKSGRVTKD
ncbi:MAG: HK97 gp10 family phage protein [Pirellulales bacterium]